MSYLQEDALNIMSTVKSSEINNANIDAVINNPVYNETLNQEDLLIETISKLWATNHTDEARIVSEAFLGGVLDKKDNFGIFLNNGTQMENIFNESEVPYENSLDIVSSEQFISGIKQGQALKGYSARAFLQKREKTKIIYFGGYVGDGNITAVLDLPNATNVTNVTLELAITSAFDLYVNGHSIGTYSASSFPYLNPITIYLDATDLQNFRNGINYIEFKNSTERVSIAGGYVKVVYSTSNPEYISIKRQYFPGIEGVINEYDSFFSPDTIVSMNAKLHYKINVTAKQNVTISLKIGSTTIYTNQTEGPVDDFVKILDNSEINASLHANGLTYSDISNRTVPMRLGFGEMSGLGGTGIGDVVLITDISGSMDYRNIPCSSTWQISNITKYNGTYGAESQDINDSQSVCIYKSVNVINTGNNNCNSQSNSKCNVSFMWKVNSSNNDNLNFYIDNYGIWQTNPESSISGNVDWVQKNVPISRGSHVIAWCYEKDASGSSGTDMGYLDYIRIVNSTGSVTLVDGFEGGNLSSWNFFCGTQKVAVAKDVDNIFIDTVLNVSGNQVGLSAYSSSPGIRYSMNLTNISSNLKNQISGYSPQSATCISCGVKNATDIIVAQSSPNRVKGMLVMTDGLANTLISGASSNAGYRYMAGMEAINKTCDARALNITVFSVAFGSDADTEQVKRMACWNCTACPDSNRLAPVDNSSSCWIQNVTSEQRL
jgi:hypothetical protein